jgi:hypothetical protein
MDDLYVLYVQPDGVLDDFGHRWWPVTAAATFECSHCGEEIIPGESFWTTRRDDAALHDDCVEVIEA